MKQYGVSRPINPILASIVSFSGWFSVWLGPWRCRQTKSENERLTANCFKWISQAVMRVLYPIPANAFLICSVHPHTLRILNPVYIICINLFRALDYCQQTRSTLQLNVQPKGSPEANRRCRMFWPLVCIQLYSEPFLVSVWIGLENSGNMSGCYVWTSFNSAISCSFMFYDHFDAVMHYVRFVTGGLKAGQLDCWFNANRPKS